MTPKLTATRGILVTGSLSSEGERVSRTRKPNIFLAGAARAGTTSVYNYLGAHPEISNPPTKEPRYFSHDHDWIQSRGLEVVRSWEKYTGLYDGECSHGVDASPEYLWIPDTPKRIEEAVQDPQVIILCRNPIKRAFSHYLMERRLGEEDRSFVEAVQEPPAGSRHNPYVDPGFYGEYTGNWEKVLGESCVHVVYSSRLFRDPRSAVENLISLIGLDPDLIPSGALEKTWNSYAEPRGPVMRKIYSSRRIRHWSRRLLPDSLVTRIREHLILDDSEKPEVPEEARNLLERIYREDTKKLENITGTDVPWRDSTPCVGPEVP